MQTCSHWTKFRYEAGEDGRLIEDEKELAVVKQIGTLHKRGLSYQKIADRLNMDGFKTKKGLIWRKGAVYKGTVVNASYSHRRLRSVLCVVR